MENNIGPLPSIDLGYEKVNSPFVFVTMANWEFQKPGFIEKSLNVLTNPNISQVIVKKLPGINRT